jgi:Tol biopolymer transport system component
MDSASRWIGALTQRARVLAYLAVVIGGCVLVPQASATYPAHNGRIAFSALADGQYQIYTVRPNGHDLRQVTQVDGAAVFPDWSPDGRRIVFELDPPESHGEPFCSISLMNADGSGLVDLTGDRNGCEGSPSFTPDGGRIVFARFDDATNTEAIWSMDLSGGDRRQITTAGNVNPEVSPDGSTLSFVFDGESGKSLWAANIDGSGVRQLMPPAFDTAVKQDWAPDGSRIVFTVNADIFDRPANIATIRPDGTGLRYLTDFPSPELRAYTGGYSPDGNWIVFRLEDHGNYGLYRMRPDGGAMHAILRQSSFKPRYIDWGPRTGSDSGSDE